MAKKVRDTIHGYIYLTKLEEAVSQHPLVLRLHYVHQTSFTYLTYPNAHSTRYPHSLGVMHVAGEIFQSALLNSRSEDRKHIALQVAHALEDYDLQQMYVELRSGKDGRLTEALYESLRRGMSGRASANPQAEMIEDAALNLPLTVLFQATRIAAMLHDVGHPPFSHIVEYGLLQARPGVYLGHEVVGDALVALITDIESEELRDRSAVANQKEFSKACLWLARQILTAEERSVFYPFKSTLLSGPIDADRLDYVRRDAYAAGMVPTYDIRRLVDAAFFRITEEQKFEIAYRPNCLSSFENFFQARYDLYRFMIYHHDVVRRNLSIQRLIVLILNPDADLRPEIKRMGEDFFDHARGARPDGYECYTYFVDAYLVTLLWQIDRALRVSARSKDEDKLQLYLDLVLRRRNDKLWTLLKRPDDYARFARQVMALLPPGKSRDEKRHSLEPVPALNRLLKFRLERLIDKKRHVDENVAKFKMAQEIEAQLQKTMKDDQTGGAVFHCHYIGTFNAGPNHKVRFSEPDSSGNLGNGTVAEEISPTVASLEHAWRFSPQLLIFFELSTGSSDEAAGALRASLWPMAVNGLASYLGDA